MESRVTRDKKNGRFKRIIQQWSLDNFDDGYVRDGRFVVYSPNHHRANSQGSALRAILAYEVHYNDIATPDYCIHHIDGNKLNDSKENLQKISLGEHTRLHCKKPEIECICITCNKKFYLPQWRLNQGRGRFCSPKCGRIHPNTVEKRRKTLKQNRRNCI